MKHAHFDLVADTLTRALALTAVLGLGAAHAADRKDDELNFNYLQLNAGWAFPSNAPLHVGLGNGVQLPGRTSYSGGQTFGAALGHQFYRDRDEDKEARTPRNVDEREQDETKPVRVELEWWTARLKRQQIQFANINVKPNDAVNPQVLFLNVALPIAESEERVKVEPDEKPRERGNEPLWRWWLGAGVGHASMSYAAATALTGCDCLRAANGNGLAFQLKLIAERRVGQDTYFFGQLGQVWLPGTQSAGVSVTDYGRHGVLNLTLGLRYSFRSE